MLQNRRWETTYTTTLELETADLLDTSPDAIICSDWITNGAHITAILLTGAGLVLLGGLGKTAGCFTGSNGRTILAHIDAFAGVDLTLDVIIDDQLFVLGSDWIVGRGSKRGWTGCSTGGPIGGGIGSKMCRSERGRDSAVLKFPRLLKL